MAEDTPDAMDRRRFLGGGVAVGTAAASFIAGGATADTAVTAAAPAALRPSAAEQQAEAAGIPRMLAQEAGRPSSDFMVDVIKSLGIEYVATNPASSCRGLHESLINYGMNREPELLTVLHEESGAAMAHGYFKVSGKPMALLFHGTVGLQHAAMAVYNAWCDRVPMMLLVGNHVDAAARRPGVPTAHSMIDPGAFLRDFTKWDDQPASLQHFADSTVRAYRVAMTPPMEPVLLSIDGHLQEHPIKEGTALSIPRLVPTAPPQGDTGAVREAARLLANAENPVIVVDRAARTPEGVGLLVELAETLNAPVVDQLGRMNFPNMHYLYASRRVIAQADVVLGLELTDFWGTVNDFYDTPENLQRPRIQPHTRLISIGVGDLYIRANYQDFQRFQPVDVAIGADAQATLPALIAEVRAAIPSARRSAIARRGDARRTAFRQTREQARQDAVHGWDASPISTARLCAELWEQLRTEDWALVSRDAQVSNWPHRLWNFEHHHQYIGGSGGAGVGYGLPAAVGAALAHRAHGRLAVNIQNDGDCMYAPGVIWTSAYHKIPLLTVMHNNRGYHQEVMHLVRVGSWRNRGVDRAHIGNEITGPDIDYAMLARSMGVAGIGPITDPAELAAAIRRGIAIVKGGEPVVIDVVTQPR
jgi:acetolactate synthase I/II/III large subunit